MDSLETPENSDLEDESLNLGSESFATERLSTQERLRLAKKRRAEQLRRWAQREREFGRDFVRAPAPSPGGRRVVNGHGSRRITFESSIMLLEAAARNDLEEVKRLLEAGVSPDSTNEDGLTALHQCCIDDSEEMMKLLISFGGNPNAMDTEKWTPLHAAATCGHLHLVKFLIDAGAELLSVNADGNMPYDLCEDDTTLSYIENEMARRGVTQELIDDTRGETERRMLSDLVTLQAKGGDLEFRDKNGATPLHIASANGYLSVVEFLLDHHVSTEVTDEDHWQPIHAAACWGHLEVVELLAQNGADVNACTRNGETPFDICEDPEIKDRLLQLKEQRLNLERPKVRRSRSASTRTQSIRRTSLREKMNTTKRDVQDEKLYFIQNFDTKQETTKPPQSTNSNSHPPSDEIVDIKDVELTLLPSYLQDDASPSKGVNDDSQSRQQSSGQSFQQPPVVPKRPPRNGGTNVEVSPTSSENPRASNHSSFTSPSTTQQQQTGAIRNSSNQNSPQQLNSSQTLADLKKQRSLSRAVHQHHQPDQTSGGDNPKKRSDKSSRNNNKRESNSSNSSGNNRRRVESPGGPDSGPASVDVHKFSAGTGEVVGPPKKSSCCKIM